MGHQCRLGQHCRCPRDTQALLEQGQGGTGRKGHRGGERLPLLAQVSPQCTCPQGTQEVYEVPLEENVLRNHFWMRPFLLETPHPCDKSSSSLLPRQASRANLPQLAFCLKFSRKGTVFSFFLLTAKSSLT